MPDSKRFLHPEAIARISRLDLRARHIVEGFLSGIHRSPYFGQSVEFLQHREYAPGDDLRHVDWKVWAKQDRFYVKQFEEDTNLRCTLLVDVSGSMRYGSGPRNARRASCPAEPGTRVFMFPFFIHESLLWWGLPLIGVPVLIHLINMLR